MLDNLILAYRAQIYEWDFVKWRDFYKQNKKFSIFFGIVVLIIVISILICIKYSSSFFAFLFLIGECIAFIFIERNTVKQYRKYLLGRQNHLNKTVDFLKMVLPQKDLFREEYVNELTERLTTRIESNAPFKKILVGTTSFAKVIILPAITYVAGVYSRTLGQLDFIIVARWTVLMVLLLGIVYLAYNGVITILRIIVCRNYDAAIALREDLMDIKLLYFSDNKR